MDLSLREFLRKFGVRTKCMQRTCSDGVVVANILKTVHPRLVNSKDYTPAYSFYSKLRNWETLNSKVLSELGLKKSKRVLERIAGEDLETLLLFLQELMKHVQGEQESTKSGESNNFSGSVEHTSDSASIITITPIKPIEDNSECSSIKTVKSTKSSECLNFSGRVGGFVYKAECVSIKEIDPKENIKVVIPQEEQKNANNRNASEAHTARMKILEAQIEEQRRIAAEQAAALNETHEMIDKLYFKMGDILQQK